MLEKAFEKFTAANGALTYSLVTTLSALTEIKRFIPPYCPVGSKTVIPGLLFQTQQLPSDLGIVTADSFSPRISVYLHSMQLKGLHSLEESFRSYLRQLCESESRLESKLLSKNMYKSVIKERCLSVIAHNTWQTLDKPVKVLIRKQVPGQEPLYVIQDNVCIPFYFAQPHIVLLV